MIQATRVSMHAARPGAGCRTAGEGALALGYAVMQAADGHSSYSKDAPRLIEEWSRKLGEARAAVMPAAQIEIAGHA